MISSGRSEHDLLVSDLANRYQREGYVVLREPNPEAIPFQLGGYRPDLIARKGGQNLIVEVKTQPERISFDRLRSLAHEVRQHEGWKFILVTGRDLDPGLPGDTEESFSWTEVSQAMSEVESLRAQHGPALAFLRLWMILEKMMRFRARQIALPVDRLASPDILIGQLYSHGELSMPQFDTASALIRVRNRVVHGLDDPGAGDDIHRLATLVGELRSEWSVGE